jgi:hypothetical protein
MATIDGPLHASPQPSRWSRTSPRRITGQASCERTACCGRDQHYQPQLWLLLGLAILKVGLIVLRQTTR